MLKQIKDFERYYISDDGKVFNKNGREISQRKATNGYMRVNLRKGNQKYEKPTTVSVHRLVAEYYVPKIKGKEFVNHIDGNKTNNEKNNLEWCTSKENSKHIYELNKEYREKCNENIKKAQKIRKKEIDVYKNNMFVGRYESKNQVAKTFNINPKTLYNYMNGKTTNKDGYIFIEVEKEVV